MIDRLDNLLKLIQNNFREVAFKIEKFNPYDLNNPDFVKTLLSDYGLPYSKNLSFHQNRELLLKLIPWLKSRGTEKSIKSIIRHSGIDLKPRIYEPFSDVIRLSQSKLSSNQKFMDADYYRPGTYDVLLKDIDTWTINSIVNNNPAGQRAYRTLEAEYFVGLYDNIGEIGVHQEFWLRFYTGLLNFFIEFVAIGVDANAFVLSQSFLSGDNFLVPSLIEIINLHITSYKLWITDKQDRLPFQLICDPIPLRDLKNLRIGADTEIDFLGIGFLRYQWYWPLILDFISGIDNVLKINKIFTLEDITLDVIEDVNVGTKSIVQDLVDTLDENESMKISAESIVNDIGTISERILGNYTKWIFDHIDTIELPNARVLITLQDLVDTFEDKVSRLYGKITVQDIISLFDEKEIPTVSVLSKVSDIGISIEKILGNFTKWVFDDIDVELIESIDISKMLIIIDAIEIVSPDHVIINRTFTLFDIIPSAEELLKVGTLIFIEDIHDDLTEFLNINKQFVISDLGIIIEIISGNFPKLILEIFTSTEILGIINFLPFIQDTTFMEEELLKVGTLIFIEDIHDVNLTEFLNINKQLVIEDFIYSQERILGFFTKIIQEIFTSIESSYIVTTVFEQDLLTPDIIESLNVKAKIPVHEVGEIFTIIDINKWMVISDLFTSEDFVLGKFTKWIFDVILVNVKLIELISINKIFTLQDFSDMYELEVKNIGIGDGYEVFFEDYLSSTSLPNTIEVKVDGLLVATDDGNGDLVGDNTTGSINYFTGKCSITFSVPPEFHDSIAVYYRTDLNEIINTVISFTIQDIMYSIEPLPDISKLLSIQDIISTFDSNEIFSVEVPLIISDLADIIEFLILNKKFMLQDSFESIDIISTSSLFIFQEMGNIFEIPIINVVLSVSDVVETFDENESYFLNMLFYIQELVDDFTELLNVNRIFIIQDSLDIIEQITNISVITGIVKDEIEGIDIAAISKVFTIQDVIDLIVTEIVSLASPITIQDIIETFDENERVFDLKTIAFISHFINTIEELGIVTTLFVDDKVTHFPIPGINTIEISTVSKILIIQDTITLEIIEFLLLNKKLVLLDVGEIFEEIDNKMILSVVDFGLITEKIFGYFAKWILEIGHSLETVELFNSLILPDIVKTFLTISENVGLGDKSTKIFTGFLSSLSIIPNNLKIKLDEELVAIDDGYGNIFGLQDSNEMIITGTINYISGGYYIEFDPPPELDSQIIIDYGSDENEVVFNLNIQLNVQDIFTGTGLLVVNTIFKIEEVLNAFEEEKIFQALSLSDTFLTFDENEIIHLLAFIIDIIDTFDENEIIIIEKIFSIKDFGFFTDKILGYFTNKIFDINSSFEEQIIDINVLLTLSDLSVITEILSIKTTFLLFLDIIEGSDVLSIDTIYKTSDFGFFTDKIFGNYTKWIFDSSISSIDSITEINKIFMLQDTVITFEFVNFNRIFSVKDFIELANLNTENIAFCDGSTLIYTGSLTLMSIPGRIELRLDGKLIATDDGIGNFYPVSSDSNYVVGTINYLTGNYFLTFDLPPISNSQLNINYKTDTNEVINIFTFIPIIEDFGVFSDKILGHFTKWIFDSTVSITDIILNINKILTIQDIVSIYDINEVINLRRIFSIFDVIDNSQIQIEPVALCDGSTLTFNNNLTFVSIPGKIEIILDGKLVAIDDGEGNIFGSLDSTGTNISGLIDYTSGEYSISFTIPPEKNSYLNIHYVTDLNEEININAIFDVLDYGNFIDRILGRYVKFIQDIIITFDEYEVLIINRVFSLQDLGYSSEKILGNYSKWLYDLGSILSEEISHISDLLVVQDLAESLDFINLFKKIIEQDVIETLKIVGENVAICDGSTLVFTGYLTTHVTSTLLVPGTIGIKLNYDLIAIDDEEGNIFGYLDSSGTSLSGTIDYNTGEYYLSFSSAPGISDIITISYGADLNDKVVGISAIVGVQDFIGPLDEHEQVLLFFTIHLVVQEIGEVIEIVTAMPMILVQDIITTFDINEFINVNRNLTIFDINGIGLEEVFVSLSADILLDLGGIKSEIVSSINALATVQDFVEYFEFLSMSVLCIIQDVGTILEIVNKNKLLTIQEIIDVVDANERLNLNIFIFISDIIDIYETFVETIAFGDGSTSIFQGSISSLVIISTSVELKLNEVVVATDNGLGGFVGNNITGTINYMTGEYYIYFPTSPEINSQISIAYRSDQNEIVSFTTVFTIKEIGTFSEKMFGFMTKFIFEFPEVIEFLKINKIFTLTDIITSYDEEIASLLTVVEDVITTFDNNEIILPISILINQQEVGIGIEEIGGDHVIWIFDGQDIVEINSIELVKINKFFAIQDIIPTFDYNEIIDIVTPAIIKEFGGTFNSITFEDISLGDGSTLVYTGYLSFISVMPISIEIRINGILVAADNGTGNFYGPIDSIGLIVTGDINYSTGEYSIVFNEPPEINSQITADYSADINEVILYIGILFDIQDMGTSVERILGNYTKLVYEDVTNVIEFVIANKFFTVFDIGNIFEVKLRNVSLGDNTTLIFSGSLYEVSIPLSINVRLGNTIIASDDGTGNLVESNVSGTIDYITGDYSIIFINPPETGILITIEYSIDSKEILDISTPIFLQEIYTTIEEVPIFTLLLEQDDGTFEDKLFGDFTFLVFDNVLSFDIIIRNKLVTLLDIAWIFEFVDVHSPFDIQDIGGTFEEIIENIAIGDGSTSIFSGILPTAVVADSFDLEVDTALVAIDDGNGNILGSGVIGTINYNTGFYSIVFDVPPIVNSQILVTYNSDQLEKIVGIDTLLSVFDNNNTSIEKIFGNFTKWIYELTVGIEFLDINKIFILQDDIDVFDILTENITMGDGTTLVFSGYLTSRYLIPTKVQVKLDNKVIATDNGEGSFIVDSSFSGTINYVTGEYSLEFMTPPELSILISITYGIDTNEKVFDVIILINILELGLITELPLINTLLSIQDVIISEEKILGRYRKIVQDALLNLIETPDINMIFILQDIFESLDAIHQHPVYSVQDTGLSIEQIPNLTSNLIPVQDFGTIIERILSDNGLLAYYPFNGNINDESGNENHGVILSGPTLTTDRFGDENKTYQFDGINDYIELPSINVREATTISAWVKSASESGYKGYRQIINKYLCYILGTSGWDSPVMAFIIYTDGSWKIGANYVVPDPQNWHHFVGTYDSSTGERKLYVDGEMKASTPTSGLINTNQENTYLSSRQGFVHGGLKAEYYDDPDPYSRGGIYGMYYSFTYHGPYDDPFHGGGNTQYHYLCTSFTPTINYYWGNGIGPCGVVGYNWHCKWIGWFYAPVSKTYGIAIETVTSGNIKIDGTGVASTYHNDSMTWNYGSIYLTAGYHVIEVNFWDHRHLAGMKVYWNHYGGWTIIPANNLCYAKSGAQPNWTTFKYSQNDPVVDFDWGDGSPNPGQLGNDFFSVKWTGWIHCPEARTYGFGTYSYGGSLVYINGILIVNNDGDHDNQWRTGSVYLPEGHHTIEVKYRHWDGPANINLYWDYGGSWTVITSNYLAYDHLSEGYFEGKIDNVRIYDRALDENEIRSLYERESIKELTTDIQEIVEINDIFTISRTFFIEDLVILDLIETVESFFTCNFQDVGNILSEIFINVFSFVQEIGLFEDKILGNFTKWILDTSVSNDNFYISDISLQPIEDIIETFDENEIVSFIHFYVIEESIITHEKIDVIGYGDNSTLVFTGFLVKPPLANTVKIFLNDSLLLVDDEFGSLIGDSSVSGNVNYETGEYSVTFIFPPAFLDFMVVRYFTDYNEDVYIKAFSLIQDDVNLLYEEHKLNKMFIIQDTYNSLDFLDINKIFELQDIVTDIEQLHIKNTFSLQDIVSTFDENEFVKIFTSVLSLSDLGGIAKEVILGNYPKQIFESGIFIEKILGNFTKWLTEDVISTDEIIKTYLVLVQDLGDEIFVENIATGDGSTILFTGFLVKHPIMSDNVEIFLDDDLVAADDGFGNIFGIESLGDVTGTINYITGEYHIEFVSPPEIDFQVTISYLYDIVEVIGTAIMSKVQDIGVIDEKILGNFTKWLFDSGTSNEKVLGNFTKWIDDIGTILEDLTLGKFYGLFDYGGGKVIDNVATSDDSTTLFTGFSSTSPILPDTIEIKLNDDLVAIDDGFGNIFGMESTNPISGSINYNTGEYSLQFVVPPEIGSQIYLQYLFVVDIVEVATIFNLQDIGIFTDKVLGNFTKLSSDYFEAVFHDINIKTFLLIEDVDTIISKIDINKIFILQDIIDTSGLVIEELAIGDGSTTAFAGEFEKTTIVPYSIDIKIDSIVVAIDDGYGNFQGTGEVTITGIVDYITGIYSISFSPPPNINSQIVVYYALNIEIVNINKLFEIQDIGLFEERILGHFTKQNFDFGVAEDKVLGHFTKWIFDDAFISETLTKNKLFTIQELFVSLEIIDINKKFIIEEIFEEMVTLSINTVLGVQDYGSLVDINEIVIPLSSTSVFDMGDINEVIFDIITITNVQDIGNLISDEVFGSFVKQIFDIGYGVIEFLNVNKFFGLEDDITSTEILSVYHIGSVIEDIIETFDENEIVFDINTLAFVQDDGITEDKILGHFTKWIFDSVELPDFIYLINDDFHRPNGPLGNNWGMVVEVAAGTSGYIISNNVVFCQDTSSSTSKARMYYNLGTNNVPIEIDFDVLYESNPTTTASLERFLVGSNLVNNGQDGTGVELDYKNNSISIVKSGIELITVEFTFDEFIKYNVKIFIDSDKVKVKVGTTLPDVWTLEYFTSFQKDGTYFNIYGELNSSGIYHDNIRVYKNMFEFVTVNKVFTLQDSMYLISEDEQISLVAFVQDIIDTFDTNEIVSTYFTRTIPDTGIMIERILGFFMKLVHESISSSDFVSIDKFFNLWDIVNGLETSIDIIIIIPLVEDIINTLDENESTYVLSLSIVEDFGESLERVLGHFTKWLFDNGNGDVDFVSVSTQFLLQEELIISFDFVESHVVYSVVDDGFVTEQVLNLASMIIPIQDFGTTVERILSDNGLLLLYPFNGNANDESWNNKHGMVVGPVLTTDRFGNENKAYHFDGINDAIEFPSVNPNNALTVSVWIKSDSESGYKGYRQIINKYLCYVLGTSGWDSPTMSFIVYTGGQWRYGASYLVSDPQNWHHFVGTYDSSTGERKLYMDGELKASTPTSGLINVNSIEGHLGSRPGYVHGGLSAEYYDDPSSFYVVGSIRIYFRKDNEGSIHTEDFNQINFNWGEGRLPWLWENQSVYDWFNASGDSWLHCPVSRTYGFRLESDNYSYLRIDGDIILEENVGSETTYIYLTAGYHEFGTYYHEEAGGAYWKLYWDYGGWQLIAGNDFYRNNSPSPNWTTLKYTQIDSTVNFNWTANYGPNYSQLGNNYYSVKWTGWIHCPEARTYGFGTYSCNGSKVYVNGVFVVNNDGRHSNQWRSGSIYLGAGYHTIEIRYRHWYGSANINLYWDYGGSWTVITSNYLCYDHLSEGYFEGKIDNVRIYDRALDENEIRSLYGKESINELTTFITEDPNIAEILDISSVFTVEDIGIVEEKILGNFTKWVFDSSIVSYILDINVKLTLQDLAGVSEETLSKNKRLTKYDQLVLIAEELDINKILLLTDTISFSDFASWIDLHFVQDIIPTLDENEFTKINRIVQSLIDTYIEFIDIGMIIPIYEIGIFEDKILGNYTKWIYDDLTSIEFVKRCVAFVNVTSVIDTSKSISSYVSTGDGSTVTFIGQLNSLSILPNSLVVKIDNNLVAIDDGVSNIFGIDSYSSTTGTINYVTGDYSITFSIPPEIDSQIVIEYKSDVNEIVIINTIFNILDSGNFTEQILGNFTKWIFEFGLIEEILIVTNSLFIVEEIITSIDDILSTHLYSVSDIIDTFDENEIVDVNTLFIISDSGIIDEQIPNIYIYNPLYDLAGLKITTVNINVTLSIQEVINSLDVFDVFRMILLSDLAGLSDERVFDFKMKLNIQEISSISEVQSIIRSLDTTELYAFYPFNGNADDATQAENNGIVYGASLTTDRLGNANKAYFFVGENDYIYTPFNVSAGVSFSVSLWVKYSPQPERIWVLAFGMNDNDKNGFNFLIDTNGVAQIGCYRGTQCETNVSTYQGQWMHVVFTYDAQNEECKTYINSNLVSTITETIDYMTDIGINVGIPITPFETESYFKGSLDNIRFYSKVLILEEVNGIYQHELQYSE